MVKALSFKGDKKPKKRKHADASFSTAAPTADSDAPRIEADRPVGADDDPDQDDSWVSAEAVSDVGGPVVLVLPTSPPTALACDPSGKVFALPLENIVDGNPASAEPHDVRQVWVVNRVAGTEMWRFRGSHGKYLSSDKHGILAATSDTISPLESFDLLPTPDLPGTFQLRTQRETYVSAKEHVTSLPSSSSKAGGTTKTTFEVRGDAEEGNAFATTLRIRMQARFKPRVKTAKEERAREKISRRELEDAVGRRLDEEEVRRLKRARREGDYHEQLLMLKVKNKHDKYG